MAFLHSGPRTWERRSLQKTPLQKTSLQKTGSRFLRVLGATLACLVGCSDDVNLVPLTAERDPRLPQLQVTVAGHTRALHLETFGDPDARVLFAFHGGEGSDYRAMLPLRALSDRYFVVMWDSRGSGLSERITREEISAESYADEVHVLKQHFSPERPITLIGYSYGGRHAAMYLSRFADDVTQLALIEPNAADSVTAASEPEAQVPLAAEWVHDFLWQNEFVTPDDHDQLDFKLSSVAQSAIEFLSCNPQLPSHYPIWRLGAVVWGSMTEVFTTYDYRAALSALPFPVLIVASGCGGLNAERQRATLAPLFGDARVVELGPGVDHLNLFDTGRDALLLALKSYLHAYQEDQP